MHGEEFNPGLCGELLEFLQVERVELNGALRQAFFDADVF